MIRGIKHQSPDDKERYRLYIAQLQDSSTLGVLEAFMEEAPQVNSPVNKYTRRIIKNERSVWKSDETLSRVFDIRTKN